MDVDTQGKFAIHAAAREGQLAVVESLLNADKRLATRRDEDERLPFHWAVSYNRLPIVKLLAEQKSFDVDASDGAGWTGLHIACGLKDADELVDFLLAKAPDVDAKTSTGVTPLQITCSKANIETARKLLDHKASARLKDKRNQMAIHRAAAVGNVPTIKLLLQHRSPINATDLDGSTPLHHAIAEGHGDAAVVLLKAGAETDKKDGNGALAIDLAPDAKVRSFVLKAADEEGIDLLAEKAAP